MTSQRAFLEKCTLLFNEILYVSCDIDSFNSVDDDYESSYKLGGYTVIQIPDHKVLAIIWSANNCIFANLETQLININVYSPQTHGTLKNVRLFPELRQIKLLFLGVQNKPSADIYGQKHFIKEVHDLDYEQLAITYKSSDVISYSNGVTPAIL